MNFTASFGKNSRPEDDQNLKFFRLLEFEIKVRIALLDSNIDKAIRLCTNMIHLFPSDIKPRKLLTMIWSDEIAVLKQDYLSS